jgi:hypothetical protein
MGQIILCTETVCKHNKGGFTGHDHSYEHRCTEPDGIVISTIKGCQCFQPKIIEECAQPADKTCEECGLQNSENCNTCMNVPPEPKKGYYKKDNLNDDFGQTFGVGY